MTSGKKGKECVDCVLVITLYFDPCKAKIAPQTVQNWREPSTIKCRIKCFKLIS